MVTKNNNSNFNIFPYFIIFLCFSACVPEIAKVTASKIVPESYNGVKTNSNSGIVNWKNYFNDQNIISLVDTALENNQEMKVFVQELEIAKNEVLARSGAYLPSIELDSGAGLDKVGRYTRFGSLEENNQIEPGKNFPEPLFDYKVGVNASWELDIWKKLRNAEKSALTRYLATIEGRNFLQTNLIAEIANSYFELLALDTQLNIINQNIELQNNALEIVKLKKEGARVTELAIKRFEAQLFNTKSLKFSIEQKLIETENKINFLVGRYPQPVARSKQDFTTLLPKPIDAGLPSHLIENRPDVIQAELEMAAADLDVEVAKARFYPSLRLSGDLGYEAYKISQTFDSPQSLIYSLGASITGPLINRREIEAMYLNANAKQVQAVVNYERVLLNAFIEVSNQLSNLNNLQNSYDLKTKQVQALSDSVDISNTLFNAARADYMEVLLTQRDALESKVELIETKVAQLHASVNIYRALGGGWNKEKQ